MKDYGMLNHYMPLLAPVDKADASWASPYIDLKDVLDCTIFLQAGAFTFAASTATVTVTVEASSAGTSNATEAAIAFNYRVISAVGTDTTGAVTAATASGVTLNDGDGSKTWMISIDPAAVQGALTNKNGRFVRVVATKSGTLTADLWAMMAVLKPRHAATTMIAAS